MTSDSIIKCAFCDTPFCSKGPYLHHLSKVHFVKDELIDSSITPKTQTKQHVPLAPAAHSPKSTASTSSGNGVANSAKSPTPPLQSGATFEESPHSKFLKYTELAKQLSSKYV